MRSGPLSALRRHPQLRRLVTAQFISVMGDAAFTVALAGILLLHGRSGVFSVSVAAQILGGVLALPVSGLVADRLKRRNLMVGSDLTQTVLVLAVLAVFDTHHLLVVPPLSFLMGAAGAVFVPAGGALMAQLVPQEDLRASNSARSFSVKMSGLVGPALAGGVLVLTTRGALILIDAASFLISAALLSRIRTEPLEEARAAGPRRSMVTEARDGLRVVRERPWVTAIMLQGAVQVAMILGPEQVLVPIYLSRHRAGNVYGVVLSCQAVGAMAGALLGPRAPRNSTGLWALCSLALVMPELVVFMTGGSVWFLPMTSCLTGGAFAFFGVLWISSLQVAIPREVQGRVFALDGLANSALLPLGVVLVPAVLAATSLSVIGSVLLVALLVSTIAPAFVPGVLGFRDAPAQ